MHKCENIGRQYTGKALVSMGVVSDFLCNLYNVQKLVYYSLVDEAKSRSTIEQNVATIQCSGIVAEVVSLSLRLTFGFSHDQGN